MARLPRSLRRLLPTLGLSLGLALASGAGAAGPQRWQVAPAGPCAEAETRNPCPGGACTSSTPARSRFDPTDVAANGGAGRGGAAPPEADSFPGPGSCADPSTPCGATEPTRLAESPSAGPVPPPGAPSPAGPPVVVPPPPASLPPAPPAPTPPSVVEQPGGPGTLPGLP
jgi:hypothetical protein